MGFSNGGTTCLQIAIRHSALVNKLVLASATFKREGMQPGFFDGFAHATLEMMPAPLREAYLSANPDPKGLRAMFDRDVAKMVAFKDISDSDVANIQAPALVINGDSEVVRAAHALALSQTLPRARLAILPSGHGDYIGEICTKRIRIDRVSAANHDLILWLDEPAGMQVASLYIVPERKPAIFASGEPELSGRS
jgi:pimeloyl-ACP methyl ester carboxylesterase